MPKVLVICGATASGKTSLAVSCAEKLISDPVGDFLSDPQNFSKTKLSAVMDIDKGKLFIELR